MMYHHSPFHGHPAFRGHPAFHGHPSFYHYHHHNPRHHFMPFPLRFLKAFLMFATATALFSLVFRAMVFFTMVLFSPPVLFLGLVALLSHKFHDLTASERASSWPNPCMFRNHVSGCSVGRNGCGARTRARFNGRGRCCRSNETNSNNEKKETKLESCEEGASANSDVHWESIPFPVVNRATTTQGNHTVNAAVHREETEDALTLAFDVPGFALDDINVTVEQENELVILGTRVNRVGDTFEVNERFLLHPETYNLDAIDADLSEGVLVVSIQKNPAPQPRVITSSTKKED